MLMHTHSHTTPQTHKRPRGQRAGVVCLLLRGGGCCALSNKSGLRVRCSFRPVDEKNFLLLSLGLFFDRYRSPRGSQPSHT
jgi:hypothetical protein